jgi:hypothetical protein
MANKIEETDGVKTELMKFNVKAPRLPFGDSLVSSKNISIKNFNSIPEVELLELDDIPRGIVYYPTGKIEHAYLVFTRDTVPLKISFKYRPIKHDYRDKEYWKKNQTHFYNYTHHQQSYALWVDIIKTNGLPILAVGM